MRDGLKGCFLVVGAMPEPTPDARDDEGTPLWVKIVGALVLLMLIAFVVLALVDGGHGPSRHAPSVLGGVLWR